MHYSLPSRRVPQASFSQEVSSTMNFSLPSRHVPQASSRQEASSTMHFSLPSRHVPQASSRQEASSTMHFSLPSRRVPQASSRQEASSTMHFSRPSRAIRCSTAAEEVEAENELIEENDNEEFSLRNVAKSVRKGVWCAALAACVALQQIPAPDVFASDIVRGPVLPELAGLLSGPPVKDPNALLRYALPIQNKPIKEVQKTLEEISEILKLPGVKAVEPVERTVRQAARIFNQNKDAILADIAGSKKEKGQQLLAKLSEGLQDFQKVLEAKDRQAIAPKQKELLEIVGDVEEAMVSKFPFSVPAEYASKPLLKGRASVEMKVRVKDNPNLRNAVFEMTVDGYNAPVTAGNFIDLVERHFYDGMEIQRADGFVVQTGDPDGPAEGFVDPGTGKLRTIPLEIMVNGDKEPIYNATLEELGRFREQTKLPFNAFGTLAMAREEFEPESASSQIFWLLKESELTPSSANILDGTYSVFGYVTQNEDLFADLKVGDVIESIKVTRGLDNLMNPSYSIGGA